MHGIRNISPFNISFSHFINARIIYYAVDMNIKKKKEKRCFIVVHLRGPHPSPYEFCDWPLLSVAGAFVSISARTGNGDHGMCRGASLAIHFRMEWGIELRLHVSSRIEDDVFCQRRRKVPALLRFWIIFRKPSFDMHVCMHTYRTDTYRECATHRLSHNFQSLTIFYLIIKIGF